METLLKPNPGLLLWTVITFVILLLILWKAAWRPIVDSLSARADKVKDDVESAEKNRLESEKLIAEHKETIQKAKAEVNDLIARGKADAEKVKNELIANARDEASGVLEKAKKEIETSKESAISELKAEIVNISTDIASKIIAKSLDARDNVKLVEEALNNLGDKKIVQ